MAVTGFLVILFSPEDVSISAEVAQAQGLARFTPDTIAGTGVRVMDSVNQPDSSQVTPLGTSRKVRADTLVRAAGAEANRTAHSLWYGFLGLLPKVLVAIGALVLAWVFMRLGGPLLRRALGGWERGTAATAMFGICVWLLAAGVAVSVLAGDIRALVGSLGLVGLALSWALQTPIESFTGWLMNSFQGYYRVGDRVAVGDAFGDVYRIDFLTTTVWEAGSLSRPGLVTSEQPTGRLITFPNSEVLSGSIVNLTRDFPYVWDELPVAVANQSDIAYASTTLRRVATAVIGEHMREPAQQYQRILRAAGLESSVAEEPQVFVSLNDSWTTLTLRYLVGARERRIWKSRLAEAVTTEVSRPEHGDRIQSAYPRHQVQFLDAAERPATPPGTPPRQSSDLA